MQTFPFVVPPAARGARKRTVLTNPLREGGSPLTALHPSQQHAGGSTPCFLKISLGPRRSKSNRESAGAHRQNARLTPTARRSARASLPPLNHALEPVIAAFPPANPAFTRPSAAFALASHLPSIPSSGRVAPASAAFEPANALFAPLTEVPRHESLATIAKRPPPLTAAESGKPLARGERVQKKLDQNKSARPAFAAADERFVELPYSTVTDLARFRGWSTSQPLLTAM